MKYLMVVLAAPCVVLLLYGMFRNDIKSLTTDDADDAAYIGGTINDLCDRVDRLKGVNASVSGDLEIFYQSNCNPESE